MSGRTTFLMGSPLWLLNLWSWNFYKCSIQLLLSRSLFFQALIFMSNRHHTSMYHRISIKDFFPRIPKLPSDLKLVHWGPSYGFFQHHFFQALIFMSNRHHTSMFHKKSNKVFFPRIPKLPSDLKSDHWGQCYDFFQHHFFQALVFTSNRHHTTTYHKISKIFPQGFLNCPRIWNWSTGDWVMALPAPFFSIAHFYVKSPPYEYVS